MKPRRIIIVGPSGSGKSTIGDMVAAGSGVPLLCMDDFRMRRSRMPKFVVQIGKRNVRNYEHPDLWDGRAIAMKLSALIIAGKGFVVEGNHLLYYPEIGALSEGCELYYLHVDHATSVARRKTRHRYLPADESFMKIGEAETARWVIPQKNFPGMVVFDGSRSTGALAGAILQEAKTHDALCATRD